MGLEGPEIHDSPVDYSEDPKFIVGCYEEELQGEFSDIDCWAKWAYDCARALIKARQEAATWKHRCELLGGGDE